MLEIQTKKWIIQQLARGESSISELAEPHDMSLPAISKHIRILESGGFILRKKDGRIHRLQLDSMPMKDAIAWLEHYRRFWDAKLDALDNYLTSSKEENRTLTWHPRYNAFSEADVCRAACKSI